MVKVFEFRQVLGVGGRLLVGAYRPCRQLLGAPAPDEHSRNERGNPHLHPEENLAAGGMRVEAEIVEELRRLLGRLTGDGLDLPDGLSVQGRCFHCRISSTLGVLPLHGRS